MSRQRKKKIPKYKSRFEESIGALLGERAEYEPDKLKFIQPAKNRNYCPDFKILATGDYIEAKGRFTFQDMDKMLWVKEQHPDKKFYLLFMNAKSKIRKGSPTTYGDWATKKGFIWADWRTEKIPPKWLESDSNTQMDTMKSESSKHGTKQSDSDGMKETTVLTGNN